MDTSTGKGWYRNRSGAMSAARWIAVESGEHVAVSDEVTGQTWVVSPTDATWDPSLRADQGGVAVAG